MAKTKEQAVAGRCLARGGQGGREVGREADVVAGAVAGGDGGRGDHRQLRRRLELWQGVGRAGPEAEVGAVVRRWRGRARRWR